MGLIGEVEHCLWDHLLKPILDLILTAQLGPNPTLYREPTDGKRMTAWPIIIPIYPGLGKLNIACAII
jgi:hypothetical protein